jgi:hypothetical protein
MLTMICVASCALAAATGGVLDVAPVWAGQPVGFCLLTRPPHQFVAFYDAERQMTVASRTLDSGDWTFTPLPEHVGWDSHNSITMTLDDAGHLHLAGNMHVKPLVYFRSTRPLDATSLVRATPMVGSEEDRATYPHFFRGPSNQLLFTYRDGSSGQGNQIYNVYDTAAQAWRRLLDTPLVDGEGLRNAYLEGPQRGPDGYFHLCWVWRETPDCATNHDPSYARSRDLVHWERSDGTPIEVPITYGEAEIVDAIPPGGGVINGNVRLGFDLAKRPVLSYHKYDADGHTQVYTARREAQGWIVRRMTDWEYRWDFSGGGSIPFEVRVQGLRVQGGELVQSWSHVRYGSQAWALDPESLAAERRLPDRKPDLPESLRGVRSDFPGMQVQTSGDSGSSDTPGVRYLLRWETLDRNRDKPREKPWPGPSMLQVVRVQGE